MRASISKPTLFIYLAFEKTDPFIYLIIQNVDLFIYCPLIFCTHFCWLLDKYHSQFMLYQEDKQPRKISERKICSYTRMSEKWGLSHRNPEKWAIHILFVKKKGANHIPGSAEKGGYSVPHPYYAIYRTSPEPLG